MSERVGIGGNVERESGGVTMSEGWAKTYVRAHGYMYIWGCVREWTATLSPALQGSGTEQQRDTIIVQAFT